MLRGRRTVILTLFSILFTSCSLDIKQMNISEGSMRGTPSFEANNDTLPNTSFFNSGTDATPETPVLNTTPEISDASIRRVVDDQMRFCPVTDLCDHKPSKPLEGYQPCCSDCDCDKDCHLFGSCCPDRLTSLVEKFELQCITPQMKKPGMSTVNTAAFMMVSVCHPDHLDDFHKRQCENTIDIDEPSDLPIFAPVESLSNKRLFKNKFCAYCNNVTDSDIMVWVPFLECRNIFNLPTFPSKAFISSVNERVDCNIVYRVPRESTAHLARCVPRAVTRCNESGLWETYDHVIDKACISYTSWYKDRYRNVFCYMCNTNRKPNETECDQEQGKIVGKLPSFTTLLDFTEDHSTTPYTTCYSGYLWDPYQVVYIYIKIELMWV